MEDKTVADWFSLMLKVILAVVVLVFLGSESIAFFFYIFPPEQWFMAYAGFSLTSGSLLVYLFLFLKNAKTSLQKTVALTMMVIGIAGEIATAGFGMQIEAWNKQGWTIAESDFTFMVWAIRILMLAHALALLAYSFGDEIRHAFDKNNNGIPDFMEKKQQIRERENSGNRQYNSEIEELKAQIVELKAKVGNPTTANRE